MDRIDREILSALQKDARISVTTLADQLQVSVSTCHRRLRDMEKLGVIAGYRAHLRPELLGLNFQAIVFVIMQEASSRTIPKFEAAVSEILEIVSAQRLFGEQDYLLKVVTKDLDAYQKLYDSRLSNLPGVLRLTSTLVMKEIVESRPLHIQIG